MHRLAFGLPTLDQALGDGLLPGSMTLLIGASGSGKTQLSIHWGCRADPGNQPRVAIVDLASRGDSQNHANYARSIAQHDLTSVQSCLLNAELFDLQRSVPNHLSFLNYDGSRVLRSQLKPEAWDTWQSKHNRRLPELYRFIYSHLLRGTRRFVIDGIDPVADSAQSLQFDLAEKIYHQMLRVEHDWLAREVLRENFRANETLVLENAFDHRESSMLIVATSRESMLESLIETPWSDSDLAAGANTVILMGRVRQENRIGRGLYIAKHRGSKCSDEIHLFRIGDRGLEFEK